MSEPTLSPSVISRAEMTPPSAAFGEIPSGESRWFSASALGADGVTALVRAMLTTEYPVLDAAIAEGVVGAFVRQQHLFLRTLVLELNLAREDRLLVGETPHQRFASFVAAVGTPEYRHYLLQKYPVLGAFLVEQLGHYVESAQNISEALANGTDFAGAVIRSIEFIGDVHERGRQGAIVAFDDGRRCVVKHRTAAESYLQGILATLNASLRHPLSVAMTTEYGGYAISEHLQPVDRSDSDATAYEYGAWLAVCHYLNILDMHFENFITCERGPVPVDLECCFSPVAASRADAGAVDVSDVVLRAPLSRVALLPTIDADHPYVLGWSPLSENQDPFPARMHVVVGDGTDVARLDFAGKPSENSVFSSRILRSAERYGLFQSGFADCQAGLAAMVGQLSEQAEESGPRLRIRLVRKPTQFYVDIQRRVFHPRLLIDPEAFALRIADLVRRSGDDPLSGAGQAELSMLSRGYIPIFETRWNSESLHAPDGAAAGALAVTAKHNLELRMKELQSERHRRLERRSLTQSLVAVAPSMIPNVASDLDDEPGSKQELAHSILSAVTESAWLPIGGDQTPLHVAWQNLETSGSGGFDVREAAYDLYNGVPGTILALLAGANSDNDDYSEMAREAGLDCLAHAGDWLRLVERFGVYSGAAGAAYAAWILADAGLLNRLEVRDFVVDLIESCVELATSNSAWDLLSGDAGLILLLSRLRDTDLLKGFSSRGAARKLCDHLYELRLPQAERSQLWWQAEPGEEPWGGLAHGAAGVVLAAKSWPELEMARRLADGAAASQESLRIGAARWEDRRPNVNARLLDAWCHGAAGILLADGVPSGMTDESDLRAWQASSPVRDLTLCHGRAGAVVAAAELLGPNHPCTQNHARVLRDEYLLATHETTISALDLSDSLFMGRAGIAFALNIASGRSSREGNPLTLRAARDSWNPTGLAGAR